MSQQQSNISFPRTHSFKSDSFDFETVKSNNGIATTIKFKALPEDNITAGDVLVLIDGDEIQFHGMILGIDEEGFAHASDPRGSLLVSSVQ